ncbi:hypothetical protein [Neptuniibacter sp. UBA6509]|uniref:hypothetical protein n=1 Tax=Neptuniibacter sp. UBA6509 TaxID=1946976 RepID=UPI0025DC8917|nr:hypothetical protein [Neptuniibacter sp. UBA6509]|tara:strand:+ start:1366 stop:2094 length:729 start_codon:yes stop_codon:yes gene_type:complete
MSVTLLTLSRQYAAGKISQTHYRAHRHALIEEQVFNVEERTLPGFSKEPVAESSQDDFTAEYTRPAQMSDTHTAELQTEALVAPTQASEPLAYANSDSPEMTTFNVQRRMSRLSQPKAAPQSVSFIQSYKVIIIACILGVLAIMAAGTVYLSSAEDVAVAPVDDPILIKTNLLLDNPDWQASDISQYRAVIKDQSQAMLMEQRALLRSVNLYLSVPLEGSTDPLDNQVQQLQTDLETLSKKK